MPTTSTSYLHQIDKLVDDGPPEPQTQTDTGVITYFYGLRGSDDWETAERYLADQYEAGGWEPGRYRITVTRESDGITSPVTVVERLLPLHPDYAKLPYRGGRVRGMPVRAFIHRLVQAYPGATLEQVAEHFDAFDAHFLASISTAELTKRTGYALPEGHRRPLSPYSVYNHLDEVPEDKK